MAVISGTSSTDFLTGTATSDSFSGFAGNDVFVFSGRNGAQVDVIVDFGAIYFGGPINGAQEAPSTSSPASGSVSAWLNKAQTKLYFGASTSGLDFANLTSATTDNVTAAHFHRAAAGVAGGVVFGFIGTPNNETGGETAVNAPAGSVTGAWDAGEGNGTTLSAQLPALLGGQIYINFHTSANPGGDIRGQLNVLDTGQDRIDVSGIGAPDFATLQQFMSETGGSTSITLTWNGEANVLTLQGVPMASLSASDFIFADASGRADQGSEGADILLGTAGPDVLQAMGGGDRIIAGDGNDQVYGGSGDDDVNGNQGADLVLGDDGADTVRGGQGNDSVYGGAGNDPHVNGNLGDDLVYGGDGNDTVYGGQGNDTLYGDAGDDRLSGDLGADILYGGAGADRFLFRTASGNDWVADFNGAEGDRIQLVTGTSFTIGSYQNQVLVTLSTGESIGLVGVSASNFSSSWVVFG